jgi:mRNA interferase RelE/StbE
VPTPYHVKIAPTAGQQFRVLVPKEQKVVIKLLEALAINPRPPGVKKIDGMIGLCSEVVDNVCLVYKIEEQEVLLLLIK